MQCQLSVMASLSEIVPQGCGCELRVGLESCSCLKLCPLTKKEESDPPIQLSITLDPEKNCRTVIYQCWNEGLANRLENDNLTWFWVKTYLTINRTTPIQICSHAAPT